MRGCSVGLILPSSRHWRWRAGQEAASLAPRRLVSRPARGRHDTTTRRHAAGTVPTAAPYAVP